MRRWFGHDKDQDRPAAPEGPRLPGQLTPAAVKTLLDSGPAVQLVDVREPHEYAEAHIVGSILIPLGQLSARLGELRPDQPVVMMCRSGNRSSVAMRQLQQAGIRGVSNLQGGIVAWMKQGLPVKQGR